MSRHAEEIRLSLPELELAARRWPATQGEGSTRVLAIHGWLDNAASFDRIAGELPEFELVAIDLPGHGRSSHRVQGPYHFIDQVADALAATDALGWERFAVLGHSLGGSIGAIMAGTFPDRIERLAMIESLGPLAESVERSPQRLARSIEVEKQKRARKKRVYPDHEAAADQVVLATAMEKSSAMVLVERGLEPVEGGWSWSADPRLRVDSRLRLSEPHVLRFLSAIECPTLLVIGDRGYRADPDMFRARTEAVRGLEQIVFAGGHHLHLDDPGPLGAQLRRFFAASREGAS